MSLWDAEVGGWVKAVRSHTVLNGFIVAITESHFVLEGLPPLPISDWAFIIIKPPPNRTARMRDVI